MELVVVGECWNGVEPFGVGERLVMERSLLVSGDQNGVEWSADVGWCLEEGSAT